MSNNTGVNDFNAYPENTNSFNSNDFFTKALERYHAWRKTEASRIGGPYHIGYILTMMFGDIAQPGEANHGEAL